MEARVIRERVPRRHRTAVDDGHRTDRVAAIAFRTMFAYTGTVRLDGDRWATKVDVAWNPAWHGTEQIRTFKLDGDRLEVTSAWGMSVNLGKITRGVVRWERVK